jgi:hypothetical protein
MLFRFRQWPGVDHIHDSRRIKDIDGMEPPAAIATADGLVFFLSDAASCAVLNNRFRFPRLHAVATNVSDVPGVPTEFGHRTILTQEIRIVNLYS